MTKAVFKFPANDFDNYIKNYDIVKFLDIQYQDGIVCVWAVCNIGPTRQEKNYNVFKIGTGSSWSLEHWDEEHYIGTIQDGEYVWHYFWDEQREFI